MSQKHGSGSTGPGTQATGFWGDFPLIIMAFGHYCLNTGYFGSSFCKVPFAKDIGRRISACLLYGAVINSK
jgi:hypothetical protein